MSVLAQRDSNFPKHRRIFTSVGTTMKCVQQRSVTCIDLI